MVGKKKLPSEPTGERPTIEEMWIPVNSETKAEFEERRRKWNRTWQRIAERVFEDEKDSGRTDTDEPNLDSV